MGSQRRPAHLSARVHACVDEAVYDGLGVVTRTEFRRRKIGKADSESGRGGGSPGPEGFISEDAECASGCEMALYVESVVDCGVNRQEALS